MVCKIPLLLLTLLAGAASANIVGAEEIPSPPAKTTEPVSFEELFDRLPEAERIAAVTKLARMGTFIDRPEYLRADLSPSLKLQFLQFLPEPLEARMLETIAAENAKEADDRLRLFYRALLYRYGHDEERARAQLLEELSHSHRQNAALILCLNRDMGSINAILGALENEEQVDSELLRALGALHNQQANTFLARRFDHKPRNSDLLLAVALSGQQRYYPVALQQYENKAPKAVASTKRLTAAAAAALLGKPEQTKAALDFLTAQIFREDPPFQAWPLHALSALGWCGQEQAISIMKAVALGGASEYLRRERVDDLLIAQAATTLAKHAGTPAGDAALVEFLEKGRTELLDRRQRTILSERVLRSGPTRAKELLRQKFPEENWEARTKIAGLKLLPEEYELRAPSAKSTAPSSGK